MSRISIREQVLNFIALLLVQLPLLYRITLFDRAFGFFYVGFLLLLPFRLSRSWLLLAGFFTGLIVDIFSNTPGIHAGACVFIMFIRNGWLRIVNDDTEELVNINHISMRKTGLLIYLLPLVFVHHLLIFFIENGGFYLFGMLLSKTIFSSFFSFTIIFVLNYLIVPKSGRT
ncbi:MAG: Rod shape-determining protein MreD [Cyclobacteriaceae bacterium]